MHGREIGGWLLFRDRVRKRLIIKEGSEYEKLVMVSKGILLSENGEGAL